MPDVQFYIVGENFQQHIGYKVWAVTKAVKCGIERFYAEYVSDDKLLVLVDAPKATIDAFQDTLRRERPNEVIIKEITKPEPYRGFKSWR